MNNRRSWLLLLALTVLGFGLRLYRLDDQSAWNDEGVSMAVAPQSLSSITAISAAASYDSNPPLYLYVLHGFLKWFGFGMFQARLLSLIFGVLAIPMIYVLGAELFDPLTGSLSAGLLSVSELAVAYSQEARNYEMGLLLTLFATWCFARALRDTRDHLAWTGFVLATVLLAYTHYYAAFVPATLVGFAVIHRRYPLPRAWWAGGAAVCCALYVPWLVIGLRGALKFQHHGSPEEAASLKAAWWSLFSAVNFFNNGKWAGLNNPSTIWVFAAGYLLFTLPVVWAFLAAKEDRPRRGSMLMLALLTVVPVILILLAASHTGSYNYRYLVFCVAPYYVLAAHGVSRIPGGDAPRDYHPADCRVQYGGLARRVLHSAKEDNRGAVRYVRAHAQPEDFGVFLPRNRGHEHIYWRIYNRDIAWPRDVDFDQIAAHPEAYPRVWIVWDRAWWKNTRDKMAVLNQAFRELEKTHAVTDRRQFFGAERLYTRKCG